MQRVSADLIRHSGYSRIRVALARILVREATGLLSGTYKIIVLSHELRSRHSYTFVQSALATSNSSSSLHLTFYYIHHERLSSSNAHTTCVRHDPKAVSL
jgi:hypothetical protein